MQGENWKPQWLPLCLARRARRVSMERPLAILMISNQDLRVSWKPVNPHECVWKNLNQKTMRTILQEEGTIHYNITIWYTNLFLCLKQWRYAPQKQQKQRWNKNGRKSWKDSGVGQNTSQNKSEVMDEARKEGGKVHFASLMDLCHLKNAELETKHTKKNVELYSEATLWKMILDLMQYSQNIDHQHHKWRQERSWISYPDCQVAQDRQLTQYLLRLTVKMEDAPILLKIHKSECPDIWIRLPRHKWPKSCPVWKTQSFLLSEICTVILWQDHYEKGNLRKSYWNMALKKFQIGNVSLFIVKKGLFLSVYVDDIKLAGKKQNLDPMWKVLNKELDLGEPTSFLDHVYLGCTQRKCEISKDIVDNYRTMFESRISAVRVEKLPFTRKLRVSSWSFDMAGHAKKCVEWYCELANKTNQQLYKVSTPCIDDHHFKEEELKSVGEIVKKCALKLFKNACIWHVLEDPIFYCPWINLHDLLLNGPKHVTIDYLVRSPFHPAVNTNNIVMWETLQSSADWDCFKTQFSEATRSFQSAGCVRNKLQFRTAQQNQKSFPWMQV